MIIRILALIMIAMPVAATAKTPETLEVARRVVAKMGTEAQTRGALPALADVYALQVMNEVMERPELSPALARAAANPARAAAARKALAENYVAAFTQRLPVLIDALAKAYSTALTPGELEELEHFLDTPTGRKWVGILRVAQSRGIDVGRTIGAEAGIEAAQNVEKQLASNGSQ
ncbi:MAG: DUF2059 domain-containing protein [Sphingomonas sp.]|uniref:DUF2059 domain-containing protein n=1 Tax=Sphingomonas sp. TaxID=28214 RepID=UPI0025CBFCA0|nr:DUF2059 domain-containing protein [Sphingomonas sp.]MBY0285145.1 DUF2059 domain-containing protein [Sphingomonas sp.]